MSGDTSKAIAVEDQKHGILVFSTDADAFFPSGGLPNRSGSGEGHTLIETIK
jgi:hypothetical protein